MAPSIYTGAIYVVDELDYEQKQSYELLIRATDSVSGVSAEVPVSVLVQDVNDCPPEIEQDSYNITVSERAQFGTAILKVQAKDNDTGKFTLLLLVLLTADRGATAELVIYSLTFFFYSWLLCLVYVTLLPVTLALLEAGSVGSHYDAITS